MALLGSRVLVTAQEYQQESMEPLKVRRKEIIFPLRCTGFKNQTTESVLPCRLVLTVVTEMEAIWDIRHKERRMKNLRDACKHRQPSDTENRYLTNNCDWFWKPACWLLEAFFMVVGSGL